MNFFTLDLISISLVFAWIIILLRGWIHNNFGIFSAILAAFHFLISNNLWESVWTLLTNLAFKLSVYGQLFYYKTNLVSIHCPGVIIGVVIIATLISKFKEKKSLKWWFKLKECCLDKLLCSDSLKKINYARKYCVCPVQDSGEMNQETRRLASFRHRTATSPSATVLAHSGLYYDRNLCCMRCFRCQRTLSEDKAAEDNPDSWHDDGCEYRTEDCENYSQSWSENQDTSCNEWVLNSRRHNRENMNVQPQSAIFRQAARNPITAAEDGNTRQPTSVENRQLDPSQLLHANFSWLNTTLNHYPEVRRRNHANMNIRPQSAIFRQAARNPVTAAGDGNTRQPTSVENGQLGSSQPSCVCFRCLNITLNRNLEVRVVRNRFRRHQTRQGNIAARNMQPPPDLSAQDTVNPTTSSDALMSDTNHQFYARSAD